MVVPGTFAYITIPIFHHTAILFALVVTKDTTLVAISKPFFKSSCTVKTFCNIAIKFDIPVWLSYRFIDIVLGIINFSSFF